LSPSSVQPQEGPELLSYRFLVLLRHSLVP
jgi:hypothetical protein